MVLHCAGRLGVLSHLYQHRHALAHSLGLIKELPIAMCSSDYHASLQLVFANADDANDSAVPVYFSPASEIHLFTPPQHENLHFISQNLKGTSFGFKPERHYQSPAAELFKPPCNS